MKDFKQYFDEEMRYLSDEGKAFAKEFPDRASRLSLSSEDDRDPYVERLLEGFAFLTGRIQKKMDDDFPVFAENMLEIAAPDFLRPIPSMAIVQFFSRPGMLQKSHTVSKGTEVLSNPVGKRLTTCRFHTTRDIEVHPLALTGVSLLRDTIQGDGMQFDFSIEEGSELIFSGEKRISFYLHAERTTVWQLHYFLTEQVSEIVFEAENGASAFGPGSGARISAGGFRESEKIFPMARNGGAETLILMDFFSFEENFRFIAFEGEELLSRFQTATRFSVKIFFKQPFPAKLAPQKDTFRLYATPVVNVFKQQAIPIRNDQKHFEYPIIPEGGPDNELFSVEKVVGVNKETGVRREYLAFPEFRHTAARASGCHYTVKRNYSQSSGFQAGLALGSHGSVALLNEEYLSVSLKATNGSLPRRDIRENAICNPISEFPEFLHFFNITRPSTPLYPPGSDLYLWTVLSQFNANFHTLCRKDVLRESLRLYDWSRSDIYEKWIRGILNVVVKPRKFIFEGILISGSEITIRFRDAAFDNKGESNIFGMVLLAFFTAFATLNHLVSLIFIFEPSGDQSCWGPLEGQCHAI